MSCVVLVDGTELLEDIVLFEVCELLFVMTLMETGSRRQEAEKCEESERRAVL